MTAIVKGKIITGAARIAPPATLSPAAKAVFVHIVANVDPSHFSKVDLPLVEAYANSAALATEAAQKIDADGAVSTDGKLSPWLAVSEKAQKQLVALSARLRICPQSRFDRLGAGANSRVQPEGSKPWQWDKGPKSQYFDDLIARP
jgi:phage terminase small subunit